MFETELSAVREEGARYFEDVRCVLRQFSARKRLSKPVFKNTERRVEAICNGCLG